jgi:hypothetical protein
MTDGTTGGGRRLRIGNVERNAAMKALDAHLEAGRLGVEEYGDRSAKAAGATTADELEELFSDLPEPHPALPGGDGAPAPIAAAAPAVRDEGTVAQRPSGFLDTAAPRIMAVMPFVALALFFTIGGWWWFLLIPAAGRSSTAAGTGTATGTATAAVRPPRRAGTPARPARRAGWRAGGAARRSRWRSRRSPGRAGRCRARS